jgi:hypothetical protein
MFILSLEWILHCNGIFQASGSPQSQQPPEPGLTENKISCPSWFVAWKHFEQNTQVSSSPQFLQTIINTNDTWNVKY